MRSLRSAISMGRPQQIDPARVETAKKPGLYADGGGIYLRVGRGGAKSWCLRYMLEGKACEMDLGGLSKIGCRRPKEGERTGGSCWLKEFDPPTGQAVIFLAATLKLLTPDGFSSRRSWIPVAPLDCDRASIRADPLACASPSNQEASLDQTQASPGPRPISAT